jgi:hypothetical protein
MVAAAVLGGVLAMAQSAGASGPPTGAMSPSMTVTPSTHVARAHGVRLTVTLRYEMQCGYAGAGPLVVTFPSGLRLPQRLASGAVELAGKPVAATLEGQQVTVTVPRHKGMLCDLMGPGSVTVTFTQGAKLANPSQAGSYSFKASHGRRSFTAKLTVKPAG